MKYKLIDKSAIVAELERRRDAALRRQHNLESIGQETVLNEMVAFELNRIISLINTLKVKKVDLEKEFFVWYHEEKNRDYTAGILYEKYSTISIKLAKHFFELGLKAQKGE